ncbi:DUF3817 domain-containing protein [Lapillicoccus sp.]|uniref:DUF3817 domain-containing protein n=1 Tax=Lapillicoccus sp. TaxID=1909287 RepID=UPI0025DA2956|nr:DUF3817 domain-containing protein [Lapillicoccus sp.]
MSTPPVRLAKPAQIRQALKIYRVMAIVAGLALFVLIVAVYFHYGPPQNAHFSEVWSPIHGLIYFVYAVSIANLGFKSRWPLTRIVLNLLSGFVPFVPFVAERRVTRDTEALLSRAEVPGPAAPAAPGETPAAG